MRIMRETQDRYFDGDFWRAENLKYAEPHFRLRKLARIVNAAAGREPCELLDLGCGPAALARLLAGNIRYRGIDIAIHDPAPNLQEFDFIEHEIPFDAASFDIVVASGLFEYAGTAQERKFREIRRILRKAGTFVVSYINFDHIHKVVTPLYNNMRSIDAFRDDLRECFEVHRSFPVSYNWQGTPPRRRLLQHLEMHVNVTIPVMARLLGVEFVFVCAPRNSESA